MDDDATPARSTAPGGPALPGQVLRAAGLIDGAATLDEAAASLRDEADRLQALGAAGWTLVGPVVDDLGQLVDPDGNAGGDGA